MLKTAAFWGLGCKGSTEEPEPWMRTVRGEEADPADCLMQTAEEIMRSFESPFLTAVYILGAPGWLSRFQLRSRPHGS